MTMKSSRDTGNNANTGSNHGQPSMAEQMQDVHNQMYSGGGEGGDDQERSGADILASLGVASPVGSAIDNKLQKFVEHLEAVSKLSTNAITVKVNTHINASLVMPMISLSAFSSTNSALAVVVLLPESQLRRQLSETVRTIRGASNVEIVTKHVLPQVLDRDATDIIKADLQRELKVDANTMSRTIAGFVVPASTDLEEADMAKQFFANAMSALIDAVGVAPGKGYARVEAAHFANKDLTLRQSAVKFMPDSTVVDEVGRVFAADFSTSLTLGLKSLDNNKPISYNSSAREASLAKVHGRLDYIPNTVSQNQNMFMNNSNTEAKPGYVPAIIATDIGNSNNGQLINDVRTQILGLFSLAPVIENYGYVRILEDQLAGLTSKGKRLEYLGREYDPWGRQSEVGKNIAMTNSSSSPAEGKQTPAQVVSNYLTKEVAIGMEIVSGSQNEWAQDVFRRAAAGDDRAITRIFKECDALTKGLFSSIYVNSDGQRMNPVLSQTVTFYDGYYNGANGERIAIDTIDTTKALELFSKNMEIFSSARRATVPGRSNEETVAARLAALNSRTNNGIVTTGIKTTVFINPNFIRALIVAFTKAQIGIETNDVNPFSGGMNANYGIDANMFGGVISTGGIFSVAGGNQFGGGNWAFNGIQNNIF